MRNEPLIGLGLAKDGAMEVPSDPDRVGWFTGGGRPGGPGPTVLAGHVDSRTGPAVFYKLTSLKPGDRVTVTRGDGQKVIYRVTRTQDVPKDTFPTEAVFGASAGDELRLITCTGQWDRVNQTHLDNRVVWAQAVS
ncbi:class F sortase [Demetria terragena]|uniref:class F sortase n=1 Tax=Demetria terragena TaxID=63959 RepID=UPI000380C385|nr:class F sortase [Demetria terragena]